jgi:hypothetical protein
VKKPTHTGDLKVRVSAEMKAQIVALAAKVGESEGVIIRQALNSYLARIAGKPAATLYPEYNDTAPALSEPPPDKAGR